MYPRKYSKIINMFDFAKYKLVTGLLVGAIDSGVIADIRFYSDFLKYMLSDSSEFFLPTSNNASTIGTKTNNVNASTIGTKTQNINTSTMGTKTNNLNTSTMVTKTDNVTTTSVGTNTEKLNFNYNIKKESFTTFAQSLAYLLAPGRIPAYAKKAIRLKFLVKDGDLYYLDPLSHYFPDVILTHTN